MAEWTGERFILGAGSPEVHHEHLHRYHLAGLFAAGRRVLDLGCGSGTGSAIVAAAGGVVSAVDIDPDAVVHAQGAYGATVTFAVASATDLPFPDDAFDLVTCFEVIEHVTEQREVVAEVARVLAPGGVLIISTPMREEYNRGLLRPNPFHLRELDHDEFAALLADHFPDISFMGQRSITASVMWHEGATDRLQIADPPTIQQVCAMTPVYEVAVCGRGIPPVASGASLYLDLDAQGALEPSLVTQVRDARIELTDADQRARRLAAHLHRLEAQVAATYGRDQAPEGPLAT